MKLINRKNSGFGILIAGAAVMAAVCLMGCSQISGILADGPGQKQGNGVAAHGRLSVSGGMLKDEAGNDIMLRGLSSHGLGWYPEYVNAGSLRTLKAQGANLFRLAMYTEQEGGYLDEPYNLDILTIGIENAIAEDMYVIVDWHILWDGNPNQHVEEAKEFFSYISSKYGNRAEILYEICNEPNGNTSWEDVRRYAREIIPIIRSNAPDSVILVGTPEYSTDLKSAMEQPIDQVNIMYSYHKYVDVSGEKEENGYYWLKQAVDAGLPVFVTEWGIAHGLDSYQREVQNKNISDVKGFVDLTQADEFLDYLRDYNISWCGWNLSNADEIHAAIRKDCEKLSGWLDEDLTESGKLMFGRLKEAN